MKSIGFRIWSKRKLLRTRKCWSWRIQKKCHMCINFLNLCFSYFNTRGKLQRRSTYIISYILLLIIILLITLYTFNIGIWCVLGRFRRIGLVVAGRDILPYVMQAYYILIDSRPSIFVQCAKCRQRFVR